MSTRSRLTEVERIAHNTARILDGHGDGRTQFRLPGLVDKVRGLENSVLRAHELAHNAFSADERVSDRLDRLEFRLKYGDSSYDAYSRLRDQGLDHAHAAQAQRTLHKAAVREVERRHDSESEAYMADQDEAMKDELIRSLARDVQRLTGEVQAAFRRLVDLELRADMTDEVAGC